MKKYVLSLMLAVFVLSLANAQVTTSPFPLQEASQDVVIYFHADQGNQGLMGVAPPTKIYAHTGVSLNNGKTWEYATTWGSNLPKYELTWVSENLWQLYIGDMREFYGVAANETITALDFVFRSADNSKEGKGVGNSDIFVTVYDAGFQLMLQSDFNGEVVTEANNPVTFSVGSTEPANITLAVNGTTIASGNATTLLEQSYSFTEPGSYQVVASGVAGTTVKTDTLNYVFFNNSPDVAYPGTEIKMGPVANADGSVTFCVAAPGKSHMVMVGAWNGYSLSQSQVMNHTTDSNGFDYFWLTVPDLDPDTMYGYYFIVDGNFAVGDPYARLVLDPWNDKYLITDVFPGLPDYPYDMIDQVPLAIYQGSINDYDWQVEQFKGVDPSNLIIYELLFRDFTGTEGKADGNGTVQQALEKLPYLKTLGVNAIEVLPIMEFNGNNSWGYNPNFYFAPDKAYGTPSDYKQFIDVCHQNGIAVILDMVFNQSDGLHPWYQMYGGVEFSPFYNYGFNGTNGAPHAYSVLNDWNQGYPLVQQQWKDVITYWLTEYKFDGFRFDLVKGLGDNDSYSNAGDAATNAFNQSRVDRMASLKQIVDAVNPNAYFINENLAFAKEENMMAADGELNWANLNGAAQQFAKGTQSGSNLNPLYAPNDSSRVWGSTVSYLESHDEQRLAYVQNTSGVTAIRSNTTAKMQRLGSAAAQMLLSPGAHMIWQFSEMGNAQNTKTSYGNNTDPKIVNWSLLDNPDNKGLYDNYCELISIRNQNPELFTENASFTMACAQANWANGRYLYSKSADGTKELFTVINPNTSGSITVSGIPFTSTDESRYYIASMSYGSTPTVSVATGTITVPANCYVTVASNSVTEIGEVSSSSSSGSLKVTGRQGSLTIVDAPDAVDVYTMQGMLKGHLRPGQSLNLTAGVYLVTCGKESVKVLVD